MPVDIQTLISQYGYWPVFVIVLLESAGIPLPGETALLLAAAYAGATGQLNIAIVIACAAAAAILGDNLGYWVGRRFGVTLLARYGRYIHLTQSRLALGQYLFAQHGGKIVFIGRFIAFMRVFAALLAGANKYAWGPFLAFNAAGGVTWALMMGLGAYLFGNTMSQVSGPFGLIALGIAVAGIVAGFIWMRHHEKQMEVRMQAVADRELKRTA